MDEVAACTPVPIESKMGLTRMSILPCGLKTSHIRNALAHFLDFLGFLKSAVEHTPIATAGIVSDAG